MLIFGLFSSWNIVFNFEIYTKKKKENGCFDFSLWTWNNMKFYMKIVGGRRERNLHLKETKRETTVKSKCDGKQMENKVDCLYFDRKRVFFVLLIELFKWLKKKKKEEGEQLDWHVQVLFTSTFTEEKMKCRRKVAGLGISLTKKKRNA